MIHISDAFVDERETQLKNNCVLDYLRGLREMRSHHYRRAMKERARPAIKAV